MRKRIAVALLLGACAPLANADVVELSPDLYLVIRERGKREDAVPFKIAVLEEANRFAASMGKVAAPVGTRSTWIGSYLKEYEYQFRLMSRAQALAAKPTLADVVVAVDDSHTCTQPANSPIAALLPELSKLEPLRALNLLGASEQEEEFEWPAPEVPAHEFLVPEVPSQTPGIPDPMNPFPPAASAQ